jgi:putative chitinase
MGKINRKFFFDYVRLNLFGGRLKQSQVDGMNAILDEWEKKHADADDRMLAYILGTVHHETDKKFQGIEEYGRGKGRKYGKPDPETGKAYYGRGFVQLTWKYNYEAMAKVLGVDLVKKPELALDLKNCVRILFHGMMNGTFTGKKLSNYFSKTKEDWVNARRIVNVLDKAKLISGHSKKFYAAISYLP